MLVCGGCGHENGDAARFCEACGAALGAGSVEQRKTVTVVFCDLVGSTAMGEATDPERLRTVLAQYFERMKGIVETHGGTVEKFIGDAVMAVFGVPVLHEDDALRACRAAAEMRDALPELGLEGRLGVMTGEVVTGTEERLATGDAVNVAARLEQAADPGEVLLGAPTLVLVREAVEAEPAEPLALKGKAQPVDAYRLLGVLDAPERRHDAPFVGREHEVTLLQDAWQRVEAERRCELVTVVGEAGVGKSRLVAEALASVEATVVRGRCLPYGEGITYWPVVDVLKQLDVLPPDPVALSAIQVLLGDSDAVTSADEIAWAFRKALEQAAVEGPLMVVFDDIQWGEQTFLDLVDHVALLSSGAPILLVCMARPELAEQRPTWSVSLRLEPLGDEAVEELLPGTLPDDLRERISRAAGGNPLFVSEMLAIVGEADGDVVVPPTLRALLAARLDQLEQGERAVLERGSIEGEVFHRGAVQALAPGEAQVIPGLAALVRKQLIRPHRPLLAGDDGFRFHHLLLRDAAYEALPKAVRAELHERYATWLEQHAVGLVELDEILGYHLEWASRYRSELGMPGDELARRARRHLTSAGLRAQARTDEGAAVNLLGRATALLPPGEVDVALETGLAGALYDNGRVDDAFRCLDALVERAAAGGDDVGELCGRLFAAMGRILVEPDGANEELAALVEQALPVFQAAADDVALHLGYWALGIVASHGGKMDDALGAYERAAAHARHAGLSNELLGERAVAHMNGSTPVSSLLSWLGEYGSGTVKLDWMRAQLLAMLGRFEEARAILAERRAQLKESGGWMWLAGLNAHTAVEVELLAGDPLAAAAFGTEGCGLFEELGERSVLSTGAGKLAQALYGCDRLEEADAWAARAAELGATDDVLTQMLSRQVRAKVLARRGQLTEAEQLARGAVAVGDDTDMLNVQADAYDDLAEVLLLAGKTGEAAVELGQAHERYERKGNVVMAQRARVRLDEIRDTASR